MIDRGVLITLPFVGPFCRSVGAKSTTQPWRADPLTPFDTEFSCQFDLKVVIESNCKRSPKGCAKALNCLLPRGEGCFVFVNSEIYRAINVFMFFGGERVCLE